MNSISWIDTEIARCGAKATPYLLKKAKILMRFKYFQGFALRRQAEALQQMIDHEAALTAEFPKGIGIRGIDKATLTYRYVFNKKLKIKIINQLLKKGNVKY